MSKIIFHIGVAKTGTTSLQRNLFNKLENCSNLGYPNNANELYQNFSYGIRVAEDIDVKNYIEPFADKVKEESMRCPLVIISDDGLQGRGTYVYSYPIARIKSFFPNAEIMITVRNQLTAIQSYYCYGGYRLKQVPAANEFNRKKQITFNEFLDYSIHNHGNTYLHYLKYQQLLRVIERHFSKEKIHVLLFEEMVKRPEIFLSHMAKILGRDVDDLLAIWGREKPKNTRQSASYLRYQRLRTRIPLKSIRRYIPGLKFCLPKTSSSRILM